jgi:zinc transport system ATP-binding protein
MTSRNAISVKNVSFGYGKNSQAVEGASFNIKECTTALLIGPNGSGKTTLLKLMIGLLSPSKGEVKVFGKTPKQNRNLIGYVPQGLDFDRTFPMTVKEFIDFSSNGAEKVTDEVMHSLNISKLIDSHIGSLSGGELQRVLIARSLAGKPKILFLDEPASGIDIGGEQSFYELVTEIQRDQGITVVMVSHQIGLVSQFADQVICVNKKILSNGRPGKKLNAKTIEKLFGEKVALHSH